MFTLFIETELTTHCQFTHFKELSLVLYRFTSDKHRPLCALSQINAKRNAN